MIVLDTNVLSELARSQPAPAVQAWADRMPLARLCTTAITEAELRFGLALLPAGRRRTELAHAVERIFTHIVGGRVLPFDRAAAQSYAGLAAQRRQTGRSVDTADLQIAAIALARKLEAIVTRNGWHFQDCGVSIIDPWQAT
ncbi:MAG: type II toxin-antitoxin system VapC family toxin [Acetobacteraceae bacterium]|nr:type II toxin-antitoxin system VapC family toxin [Acetobacteraceae bacterium]